MEPSTSLAVVPAHSASLAVVPAHSAPLAVVFAKAGTHNHRLWNIGPRFRGDDNMHEHHESDSV
jgi:hypothetical protein